MKFAAIDIGSNAIRLLLARVADDTGQQPTAYKEALLRLPLRLGDDAFTQRRIPEAKAVKLVHALLGFQHIMTVYEPVDYMACATAAMREADNGPDLITAIHERCGIACQIIDGQTEAAMIYANHAEKRLDHSKSYLYIDVGGGSTELTLFAQGQSIASESFPLGTVRLLQALVPEQTWEAMRHWLETHCPSLQPSMAIGSGGNINKLNKMLRTSKAKTGKPITLKKLSDLHQLLCSYTLQERIDLLALRPDRADVIVPACRIYLSVLKWANISKIHVPQIGLVDGMVQVLYEKHRNTRVIETNDASSSPGSTWVTR